LIAAGAAARRRLNDQEGRAAIGQKDTSFFLCTSRRATDQSSRIGMKEGLFLRFLYLITVYWKKLNVEEHASL
jgi:hypothetical protein